MYNKASSAEKDQRKKHQADHICLTDIGKFNPSSGCALVHTDENSHLRSDKQEQ